MPVFRIKGVFLEADGTQTPFEYDYTFPTDSITHQQAVMAVAIDHAEGRIVGKVEITTREP